MQQFNYCPNCGSRIHIGESFCGHCGCRLNKDSYHAKPDTKNVSSNSWIFVCAMFVIIIGVLIYVPNNSKSHSCQPSSIYSLFQNEKSQVEIQSIKDKNKMHRALVNTIWTYTEAGEIWFKLIFKEETVMCYSAMPSDGKWTFEEECPYTLEEGRFIDDGRRYIAAVINRTDINISPKFVITNGHLTWLGIIDTGGFVLGDYEWD